MTAKINCDLIDLSRLRLDLDGAEAEEAAQFLSIILATLSDRLECDGPDLFGPHELNETVPGYSVLWAGSWDSWVTNLVGFGHTILPGWRSLRSPLVYTQPSVAAAPHVRLWSGHGASPKFKVQSCSDYGIVFLPRNCDASE